MTGFLKGLSSDIARACASELKRRYLKRQRQRQRAEALAAERKYLAAQRSQERQEARQADAYYWAVLHGYPLNSGLPAEEGERNAEAVRRKEDEERVKAEEERLRGEAKKRKEQEAAYVSGAESVPGGEVNYRHSIDLARQGIWKNAFEELKRAVDQGHKQARSTLNTVWCPCCRTDITQPHAFLAEYLDFWSGRCPKCRGQLEFLFL